MIFRSVIDFIGRQRYNVRFHITAPVPMKSVDTHFHRP